MKYHSDRIVLYQRNVEEWIISPKAERVCFLVVFNEPEFSFNDNATERETAHETWGRLNEIQSEKMIGDGGSE
jgi:hypothetical protein